MTTNQISYLKNREEARHNLAQEDIARDTARAQLQQAEAASANVTSNYITALSNQKQAEAAMNQANARWGELQYKYDTIPLYEREVGAKEKTAEASATTADANLINAKTNRDKLSIDQQIADAKTFDSETDRIRAAIENSRVQAYIKSVANEAASNELDAIRIQQSAEQFMLNYGLAKDELERKRAIDNFNKGLKIYEKAWELATTVGAKIKKASPLRSLASRLIQFLPGSADAVVAG